jgi:hypothetical protein
VQDALKILRRKIMAKKKKLVEEENEELEDADADDAED